MPKIELDIIVEHRKDGLALPKTIIWDDGRRFDIDRVLDIRKAAATKCGGIGIRYICRIREDVSIRFLMKTASGL